MAAAADPPHYYAFDDVSRSGGLARCGTRGRGVILLAVIALYHYNQSNDSDFEFLKVDHGNGQFIGGTLRYITFMAMNSAQSIKMFQCFVWRSINGQNGEIILEVKLCRVKPGRLREDFESNSPQEKRQKPETTEELKVNRLIQKKR